MSNPDPIVYVYGPPGSGKTTIGRQLSEALALPFIDLDEQIAAQAGHSIPEIFSAEGETGFRAREAAALKRRSPGRDGGGSIGRRGPARRALPLYGRNVWGRGLPER